ncbi:ABC transporter permease [Candidatus Parabeggiatoa sp. HSG14]|uniref:ABC transporter permease n=1 Tax=Candidatus Parabeggiatoa sp. HSG14 TaxID=3055593 RepID=UPI0025A6B00C|nr:ABC transporter permease [Thiotrichales bacterium HSG14]
MMTNIINAWQRLGWTEWYRSTFKGNPNRDFLWLTMLLFLTLILALLLWGGREGLLNKFVDVSVGYVEDAGIPIWLATNNSDGIDRSLLQATFSQINLKLYPYREVECHEVGLPNQGCDTNKIWDEATVLFDGWAVSFDDPLWKMGIEKPLDSTTANDLTDLPLDIVLNRSLFQQYFNCAVYVNELQAKSLPFMIPNAVTELDELYCLSNNTLWLDIKVGRKTELLPFHIHWQSHIPTMQDLAFLFPLSTLNTLKLVKRYPNLGLIYYPEAQGNETTRIKNLKIRSAEGGLSEETMTKLLACLQNPTRKRYKVNMEKQPLPKDWVTACAKQSEIPLKTKNQQPSPPFIKITEELASHYFQYDASSYLVTCKEDNSQCQPCSAFPLLQKKLGNRVDCSDNTKTKIDIIATTGSYQKAFAYVKNRTVLATQVEKIKSFQLPQQESKAFYIHPTYDDALVRFRFIDAIMIILNWLYSPFFLIFLIILLLVQVGIVITHRKHNYGILLTKGLSGQQVRWMVFTQIGISFGVAMVVSIIISKIMQWLLARQLEIVTTQKPYIDHIIAGQLDLLPLSWLDYLIVCGITLIMLVIITFFLFRSVVSKQQMEPAYLF